MKILLMEDDENKSFNIIKYVLSFIPSATITTAKSIQSGLVKINSESFDVILLDMTMPVFDIGGDEDGGRTENLGGKEILSQIDRKEIDIPVIVVTQFDRFGFGLESLTLKELDANLKDTYPNIYKGYVYYNNTMETWKESLKILLRNVDKGITNV